MYSINFNLLNTMVKFAYSILYVQDVAKSIHFYEQAFGLTKKFATPENDYGEMETGGTTLAFVSVSLAHSNLRNGFAESNRQNKPFGIELGFTTDNVEAAVTKALEADALIVEPPTTKPWGQIVAYIRDIDGFLIEICTPMS